MAEAKVHGTRRHDRQAQADIAGQSTSALFDGPRLAGIAVLEFGDENFIENGRGRNGTFELVPIYVLSQLLGQMGARNQWLFRHKFSGPRWVFTLGEAVRPLNGRGASPQRSVKETRKALIIFT